MDGLVFSPSDFVAVLNQTLDYAMPVVVIEGEVANYRLSRGRWLYFDIKDELASVKCFGAAYSLSLPIEDGMLVRLTARPQLHPQYGFSLNLIDIVPTGEGSIRRGAELLQRKLAAEGLFDESRKRRLPFPPQTIGLVTSAEAAAYGDFIKILQARWPLAEVILAEAVVQGGEAPKTLRRAVERLNSIDVDVIVLIRGGGSADDLVAFNDEQLVRIVAASRVPTMAAIGHERDVTLVELAADVRASTPSNAAELLVPDRQVMVDQLEVTRRRMREAIATGLAASRQLVNEAADRIQQSLALWFERQRQYLQKQQAIVSALSPEAALRRGYALLFSNGLLVRSRRQLKTGDEIDFRLQDGQGTAIVSDIKS